MTGGLPTLVARIKASIGTKFFVALFSLVVLFVFVGAVGLESLRQADLRTQALIDLQRRIAAYQALQSNTTALRLVVANAFLEPERIALDRARRQIGQISYDFDRAEFIAAEDRARIDEIREDYGLLVELGNTTLDQIADGQIEAARGTQTSVAAQVGDRIERLTHSLITRAEAAMLEKGAEAETAYSLSQRALVVTALGSALIALLLGYSLSVSLSRPLRRTNTRLYRISDGDFRGTLSVENRDEMGELAANVNRMSAELQSLYARLELASHHKTEFLATMSHEIRTPMNAIMGMTELVRDTELTREQRSYVDTTLDSAQALLAIIDDILDFSKIEAGALELEVAPFNLRDCIEGALETISHVAVSKDLDLVYRMADNVPEAVTGDVIRLRQVLINLLNNAVKFTEHGEVAVIVEAKGLDARSEARFRFHVQDTGIGIPADKLDRLFRSFQQVEASTTRRYGGTGLGLAISKRLIELMHGQITVDSAPGKGSTFSFDVQLGVQPGEEGLKIGGRELAGCTLVIVCDGSSTTCAEVGRYAKAWGMSVNVAETVDEVRSRLAADQATNILVVDTDKFPGSLSELNEVADALEVPLVTLARRRGGTDMDFVRVVPKPMRPSTLYNSFVDILVGEAEVTVKSADDSAFNHAMGAQYPLRILVADDHPTNRKLALLVLERLGYNADAAESGSEVLKAVEDKNYDLVLMDIHMPEMDGIEATRHLRETYPDGWPLVVVMTANVMPRDWEACQMAGALEIVRKPINLDHLTAVLRRCQKMAVEAGRQPVHSHLAAGDKAPVSVATQLEMEGGAAAHLDKAAIDRLVDMIGGNPAMLGELVESFRTEAPALFARLREGAAKDPSDMRVAAHTIKASAADFGATRLTEQCEKLESYGAAGGDPSAPEMAEAACQEWTRVEKALLKMTATERGDLGRDAGVIVHNATVGGDG